MVNINLSQQEKNNEATDIQRNSVTNRSVKYSMITIIIVALCYGAVVFFERKLDSDIVGLDAQIKSNSGNFKEEDLSEIFNLNERIKKIKTLSFEESGMLYVLSELEKNMLPVVAISAMDYDKSTKKLSLTMNTDSYQSVAKQIVSFGRVFNDVKIGGSDLEKTGDVKFSLSMKVKK